MSLYDYTDYYNCLAVSILSGMFLSCVLPFIAWILDTIADFFIKLMEVKSSNE